MLAGSNSSDVISATSDSLRGFGAAIIGGLTDENSDYPPIGLRNKSEFDKVAPFIVSSTSWRASIA